MKKWFKKRKKLKIFTLAFLSLFIVACFIANSYVKRYGYRNLGHFITTYASNSSKSSGAKYETLEIKISNADFKKLEQLREKHLQKGLIENESGDYVDADLRWNGKKIRAKIRLKGHMTDHLQDKKWSFRVKTKKGDAFMGMKVFSLQHPGTRNYIYEWIYHEMMKQEGIIALRYDFIKVKLNGESWGIYAIEEHFAQELVENNKRVKGPLIRFNPDLYWIFRRHEREHVPVRSDFSSFQSTYPEAYDDKHTFADSGLVKSYGRALNLLEGVKRKKIKVSQAFDIDKLAMFHAIIDLVGGHHSLDWSDVKYYYNPGTNLLEPVAYESFSVRNTSQLAGAGKFQAADSSYTDNWHELLFSDADFFASYIKALHKISQKKWLDDFFTRIDKPLEEKLAVLYKEFAYRDFNMQQYATNQKNIKGLLETANGLIVYFDRIQNNKLFLKVSCVGSLPFVIEKIDIDSLKGISLTKPMMIDARKENQYLRYTGCEIPLPPNAQFNSQTKVKVYYHLPGDTATAFVEMIPVGFEHDEMPSTPPTDFRTVPFLLVDGKKVSIIPGEHTITHPITIPEGYTVVSGPVTLVFREKGCLNSKSPVIFKGEEDARVRVVIETDTSVINIQSRENCFFENVDFVAATGNKKAVIAVNCYQSKIDFKTCNFSGKLSSGIKAVRSEIKVSQSYFGGLSGNGIKLHYGEIKIGGSEFSHISKKAVELVGSKGNIQQSKFISIADEAIRANEGSVLKGSWLTIENCGTGISAKNKSNVNVVGLHLNNNELGLKSYKKGDVFGPSIIEISKLKHAGNKILQDTDKKSVITIKP